MKAIVTVTGKDTTGIIAKVCTCLAENDVNILDISQTVMQEFFTMVMVVDAADSKMPIGDLRELLEKGGQDGESAGSVCDPLDGALGGGEERLRDAVLPEGGGLEQDPGDAGA